MAAVSSNVQQVGVALGSLVLSAALQEWALTTVNRINALVQFIARDASGTSVGFFYSDVTAGTVEWVPPGAGVTLPVYGTQSWWFKQDTSAGATLYASCQG